MCPTRTRYRRLSSHSSHQHYPLLKPATCSLANLPAFFSSLVAVCGPFVLLPPFLFPKTVLQTLFLLFLLFVVVRRRRRSRRRRHHHHLRNSSRLAGDADDARSLESFPLFLLLFAHTDKEEDPPRRSAAAQKKQTIKTTTTLSCRHFIVVVSAGFEGGGGGRRRPQEIKYKENEEAFFPLFFGLSARRMCMVFCFLCQYLG